MRRVLLVLALLCMPVFIYGGSASADQLPAACIDGDDNDGDGWIDTERDPGCNPPYTTKPGVPDYSEWNPPPPPEWFLVGEIPGEGDGDPSDETGSVCFQKELKRSMSETGPWGRRLFLLTTWCSNNGRITSSRSTARTSHDLFCENVHPETVDRTAGGAGFLFVEIQANVEVVCASIPFNWPKYHDTLMMRIRYFPNRRWLKVAHD